MVDDGISRIPRREKHPQPGSHLLGKVRQLPPAPARQHDVSEQQVYPFRRSQDAKGGIGVFRFQDIVA